MGGRGPSPWCAAKQNEPQLSSAGLGAYFAKVGTGFTIGIRATSKKSIFLRQTGCHFAGKCSATQYSRGVSDHSRGRGVLGPPVKPGDDDLECSASSLSARKAARRAHFLSAAPLSAAAFLQSERNFLRSLP